MGKKNKKDKENTINTRHPQKNADRKVNTTNENSDVNNILCFYTNADQLRNKLNEFERRIKELKPHIIAINEVKPKNPKCNVTIPELSIKGYTMFTKNIESSEGRGIIIYTISTLQAEQINILTTFKECLFIDVKLKNKTKLLFGCLYRSDGAQRKTTLNS